METRERVVDQLAGKPWWKATKPSLQQQVLSLPENCNGFLEDLSQRPTEIGGVRILALDALLIPDAPIFGIFPVFLVQNLKNPAVIFRYQYFSWKQGPNSGAKGLVLVRQEERITHIICLRGESFAVGGLTFDCIGGFGDPESPTLQDQFMTELKEELGDPGIQVEETILLGKGYPDRGQTNNHPSLFAAIISGQQLHRLSEIEADNPDIYEMRSSMVVIPVEKLGSFVETNDDFYFHGICNRLVFKGVISPS